MIAHELEVLKLAAVSLDGTKVKANASKHKPMSYEHANKREAQIKAEVAELLQKAAQARMSASKNRLNSNTQRHLYNLMKSRGA